MLRPADGAIRIPPGPTETGAGRRIEEGASRRDQWIPARWYAWLVAVIAAANLVRLFAHPMWRDELQAWNLTVQAGGLGELLVHLAYEGHPALWYLILFPLTRIGDDPVLMQVAHGAIALATTVLVGFAAPLSRLERLLVLLSYFFLFEYAVISRSYALTALLFLFHLWRTQGLGRANLGDWLLLGLLANTNAFGLILAGASATAAVLRAGVSWRRLLPFAALLGVMATASVGVMLPKEGWGAGTLTAVTLAAAGDPDLFRAVRIVLLTLIGPFVPIETSIDATFWPPVPGPGGLATGMVLGVLAPFVLGGIAWTFRRAPDLLLGLILIAGVMSAFIFLYTHTQIRFAGMLFVTFVGGLGLLRLRGLEVSRAALVLLAVNAAGGVQIAVASALKPFSQSAAAAEWIDREGLADSFWMATPDHAATAVAGYLQRDFYFLECACTERFVRWNDTREPVLLEDIPSHVRSALETQGERVGYLLIGAELAPSDALPQRQGVEIEPLGRVTGGMVPEEDFRFFRVRLPSPVKGAG